MTDKERIAELETGLMKAFELINQLCDKTADVSGATADAVESLKADQEIIERMVYDLWEREGVEPIDAWSNAEDRLKEAEQ